MRGPVRRGPPRALLAAGECRCRVVEHPAARTEGEVPAVHAASSTRPTGVAVLASICLSWPMTVWVLAASVCRALRHVGAVGNGGRATTRAAAGSQIVHRARVGAVAVVVRLFEECGLFVPLRDFCCNLDISHCPPLRWSRQTGDARRSWHWRGCFCWDAVKIVGSDKVVRGHGEDAFHQAGAGRTPRALQGDSAVYGGADDFPANAGRDGEQTNNAVMRRSGGRQPQFNERLHQRDQDRNHQCGGYRTLHYGSSGVPRVSDSSDPARRAPVLPGRRPAAGSVPFPFARLAVPVRDWR